MNAIELLRGQFKAVHQFLDMTIADCTPEAATRSDEGWNIKPIGTIYAHIAAAEDMMVHGMVRGGTPILVRDGWNERLGIKEPTPSQDGLKGFSGPIPLVREYAAAVFRETDEFLAGATESDLSHEVDTPIGKMQAMTYLANIVLTHCPGHWGEIAALKGVQGLKGLPF